MLSAACEKWRARGRTIRARGLDVFTITAGDDSDRTPLLLLHGFPSSSYDFHGCFDLWAARRRVVALDFPGFGFSAKPRDYGYALMEQADIVELTARELGVTRAHVVAHDMGTSVATELLARREAGLLHLELGGLVLMNGSVHIELSQLTPSQKLLRLPRVGALFARAARFWTFRAQLRKILSRPVDETELRDMFELMKLDGGNEVLPQTIRYIDDRWRFARRWIGALKNFDQQALILWGARDPVAVRAIAERLAEEMPRARLQLLEDLGHYPQLEDPARVAAAVDEFLRAVEDAADRATDHG